MTTQTASQRLRWLSTTLVLLVSLTACGQVEMGIDYPATPSPIVPTATALVLETPTATEQPPPSRTATPTSPAPLTSTPSTPPTATPLPPPTPTSPPPPTATTMPPPTSVPGPPTILSFTIDPQEPSPGQDVTVSWSSSGGDGATLDYVSESDIDRFGVPVSGSTIVKMGPGPLTMIGLTVQQVSGPDQSSTSRTLYIHPPCSDTYFFTPPASWQGTIRDVCPNGPAKSVWAAEQAFQGGRMFWVYWEQSMSTVYVLIGDGDPTSGMDVCHMFPDTWAPETDPESDPNIIPPDGLYQPKRGFGKVWRENDWVRQALEWATAPEQGFDGLYQGTQISPLMAGGYEYLRSVDGHTIALYTDQGVCSWEFVQP